MKVICYGIRNREASIFENENTFGFEIDYVHEPLDDTNINLAKGYDVVLVSGLDFVGPERVTKLAKDFGIKYIFTRSAGFNHIDLDTCDKYGVMVATSGGYSPYSVAELSVSFALNLLRNVTYTTDKVSRLFSMKRDARMVSREIRNCTVGIIGTGRIGRVAANLYKGLGARVLGFSRSKKENDECFEYVDLDTLLKESDIVSIHIPYVQGENDNFINEEFISKMKEDSILINCSRGQIQDNKAIVEGIKSEKLYGFATDVLPHEELFFGKEYKSLEDIDDPDVRELVGLYPRVLITPHVGSSTDQAAKEIVKIALENINCIVTDKVPQNKV